MKNFFRLKKQKEDNSFDENVNVEVVEENSLPEEEYKNASVKRKKWRRNTTICILGLELIVMGGLSQFLSENDIQTRIAREREIRANGCIELASGTYKGATDFGYFSGEGKFVFNKGSEYIGSWEENRIRGNGTLKIPSEGSYEGTFKNSQKNGTGIFTWDDGTIYDGEWVSDQMWGIGKYVTKEGETYSGTFEKNKFISGKCDFSNDTGEYVLNYKNGSIYNAEIKYVDGTTYTGTATTTGLTGNGKMTFATGDVYTGSFKDGKRNGNGVYEWNSGNKYDGVWQADQMNGSGIYTYYDGSYVSGQFEKNAFISGEYHIENDFGTYQFTIADGEATKVKMTLADGTVYSGDMDNGELSGKAQIKYSNGDQYDGNVSSGQKYGQGKYTWNSGAVYDGSWESDQMSGEGTYNYPSGDNGYKLVGTFAAGKPNGTCQYYVDSTTSYQTDWSNGKCEKIYE